MQHPKDCPWHKDWHACNCGAFAIPDNASNGVSHKCPHCGPDHDPGDTGACSSCGGKTFLTDAEGAVLLHEQYNNSVMLNALHRELNEACGWGEESVVHAYCHIGNVVRNLRADVSVERTLREKAEADLTFTEDWWAAREARLRDLCKQHGCWDEAAAILANGTASPTEPPTYAQALSTLRSDVKRLTSENERAQALVREFSDENARLDIECDKLRDRSEKAEANYAFMVKRAMDEKLDGYRELGARAANAESEADRLRARLRETAQVLIEEIGADGPMDAEDAARKAVERMRKLRELADRSAAEAGLYARRMGQAQETRDRVREEIAQWLRDKSKENDNPE